MFVKQSLAALGVILVAAIANAQQHQQHSGLLEANWIDAQPGTPAPELLFTDQAGNQATLDDYAGKAVVVNFWATWCGPCRAEMPTLQALAEQGFDNGDHVVLTIALERDFAAAKRFLDNLGAVDVDLVLDTSMTGFRGLPDQGLGLEDVRGLPATLVISKDGHLLGHIAGPADWNDDIAHSIVNRALSNG